MVPADLVGQRGGGVHDALTVLSPIRPPFLATAAARALAGPRGALLLRHLRSLSTEDRPARPDCLTHCRTHHYQHWHYEWRILHIFPPLCSQRITAVGSPPSCLLHHLSPSLRPFPFYSLSLHFALPVCLLLTAASQSLACNQARRCCEADGRHEPPARQAVLRSVRSCPHQQC